MHLLPPTNISKQSAFTLKPLTVACWLATFASVASAASYTEDTTITGNPPSQIELGEGVDLVVNEGTLWTPNVTGASDSTLTINISKDRTQGTNIYLNDDSTSSISVGKLTLINENAQDENNGKGIYSYNNAHLNVNADTIVIKAHNDGVYTNLIGDGGIFNTPKAEFNFSASSLIFIESTNTGSGLMNNARNTISILGGKVSDVSNITDAELVDMTGDIVINGSAGGNDRQAAVANWGSKNITLAGETIWINQVVDVTKDSETNVQTETVTDQHFLGRVGLSTRSSGDIKAFSKNGVNVYALDRAVNAQGSSGEISIYALEGDNRIIQANRTSSDAAYAVFANGSVDITAKNGNNHIQAESGQYAVSAEGKGSVKITGTNNYFSGLLATSPSSWYKQKASITINSALDENSVAHGIAKFESQTVAFSDSDRKTDSVSALFVKGGGNIDVNAGTIEISTSIAEDAAEDITHRERAV